MLPVYAVVLAAGHGERMGLKGNKVYLPLGGMPVLRHSLLLLGNDQAISGLIVVCAKEELALAQAAAEGINCPVQYAYGGDTRQRSVCNGLALLPGESIALIHDGARPFLTGELVARCIASAWEHGSGVAALPVTDTIKSTVSAVAQTVDRTQLLAMQTPQCFTTALIKDALADAEKGGATMTDDASALERAGVAVHYVQGSRNNLKLTTQEDYELAKLRFAQAAPAAVTGFGTDVHRLVENRPLILCGVTIPCEKGLDGHSDADVAVHALMDAMLGAACLGDIGRHFPDTDPAYKGISSMKLLQDVAALLAERGLYVAHADVTIVAQRPKLAPYMPAMVETLQAALPGAQINVKATTTEQLGFTGRGEGILAEAVVTVCRR